MNGGGGMFENENFTPPLGGYPTRDRPQAGFAEAERTSEQGTSGTASTEENGSAGQSRQAQAAGPAPTNQHALHYDPAADPSLSAADDERLRAMVTNLRFRQPDEFDVFSRMAQIEKELADVKAIVDLQTEVILRLRGAA